MAIITRNTTLLLGWRAGRRPSHRRRIASVGVDAVITLAAIAYMQFDDSSAAWIGLLVVAVEAALTLSTRAAVVAVGLLLLSYAVVLTGADLHYARPMSWAQLTLAVTITSTLTAAALASRPPTARTAAAEL